MDIKVKFFVKDSNSIVTKNVRISKAQLTIHDENIYIKNVGTYEYYFKTDSEFLFLTYGSSQTIDRLVDSANVIKLLKESFERCFNNEKEYPFLSAYIFMNQVDQFFIDYQNYRSYVEKEDKQKALESKKQELIKKYHQELNDNMDILVAQFKIINKLSISSDVLVTLIKYYNLNIHIRTIGVINRKLYSVCFDSLSRKYHNLKISQSAINNIIEIYENIYERLTNEKETTNSTT